MADFKIVPRQEIGCQAWDAFVDASDEAWLWHRYDFQDALATWPGYRDMGFAVLEPGSGRLLAVMPLHLVEGNLLRLIPWKTLDSLGGPACVNGLGEGHHHHLLQSVSTELKVLAQQRKVVETNLALSPMAPVYRGDSCPRVNPLISAGYENTLTQTWVIDLRQGKDDIWAHFEKRARTAIRKAEKLNVRVRAASGEEDLDVYYNLHCETYHRTGAKPHPRNYFKAIWEAYIANGLAWMLIAEHDGVPISAENFGCYKNAVIYWTGASSQLGLDLQASSLVQWIAIQKMVDEGFHFYETGEAFPSAEGKLKGLNDFKQSFGGTLYPRYSGRFVMKRRFHQIKTVLAVLAGGK